ncbi:MAG: hypothetical protein J6B29_00560 [Clostridia bacterium]|nr:hypothetical protein [Clostridia bacterium]
MTAFYDGLSKIVKVILHIFFGYLISGIYRIVKFLDSKNVVTLVAGILVLVTGIGNLIAWIVDLVTLVTDNKISVLAD